MMAKLLEIKEELRRRMHQSIPQQGAWLKQVISGFLNYHAVPINSAALSAFRYHVTALWLRAPRRRSQDNVGPDGEAGRGLASETPYPSPLAEPAVCRQTPEVGAVCGNPACTDLCGGRSVMGVPTANLQVTRSTSATAQVPRGALYVPGLGPTVAPQLPS
jgi:hypothetical protein